MKQYKAILFDMDGTVLNTLPDLTAALNHVFTNHGMAAKTEGQVRTNLGYGYSGLIDRTAGPAVTSDERAALLAEFTTYYSAHCQIKTEPYSGIPDVLKALKDQGYKTAIVSNKGQAAVDELHAKYFKDLVYFSLGETPQRHKKPAPDMPMAALERLGCTPDEAIYIGDSEVDYQTAVNAHLDSVLVTWGFRDADYLETLHPTYLVHTRDELKALFLQ